MDICHLDIISTFDKVHLNNSYKMPSLFFDTKKILITVFFMLTILMDSFAQWTNQAPMLTPRWGASSIELGGKIYVIAGSIPFSSNKNEVYDPATNTWETKAPKPTNSIYSPIAAVGGKIYVFSGFGSTFTAEEYDPVTDSWTTKSTNPIAMSHDHAVVINDKIYVFGFNGTAEYDPVTDTWIPKTTMPMPRSHIAAVALNNKAYIIGGQATGVLSTNTLQEYDPVTDTWTTKTSMSTGRHLHAADVLCGKIAVLGGLEQLFGGGGGITNLDSYEQYDPLTDTWTAEPSLSDIRYRGTATSYDGSLYVFGGVTSNTSPNIAIVEKYTGGCDTCMTPVLTLTGIDTICNGESTTITATGAASYLWNTGDISSAITVAPTMTTTYNLMALNDTCRKDTFFTVVVNSSDVATVSYSDPIYCLSGTDPIPIITGMMGGLFSIDNGGDINFSTGEINLSASESGIYTVNYTTSGICPITVNQMLEIENLDASITPVGPFCTNSSPSNLIAIDQGGIWQGTGVTDTVVGLFNPSVATVGTHTISYAINTGICSDSDTIEIIVNQLPEITYISLEDTCQLGSGSIDVTVTGGVSPIFYNWSNGSSTEDIDDLIFGAYVLTITDADNVCSLTELVDVTDESSGNCEYYVYVPNVFSPNGDGNNDMLYVRGRGIESLTLNIYNRWGNKVYGTDNIKKGWDGRYKGKEQESGVYVYFVEADLLSGERVVEKGDVSILR